MPAFDELTLLDTTGQEIVKVSRLDIVTDNDLQDRSDSPAFQMPLTTGEIHYGEAQIDDSTGQLIFNVFIALLDYRTDTVTHILLADIRLQFLSNLLATNQLSDDVYIVDSNGRVIAHENSSLVLRGTQFDAPDEGGVYTGLQGDEVVLAISPLELGDVSLLVVAEQSRSEAFALVTNTLYILAGIFILTLVLALIISIVATSSIVLPIRELALAAEKIEAGDLSQQVTVRSKDEVGTLARAFNDMAQQLGALVGNLESRVQARTRDLELAAEVSKEAATVMDPEILLPRVSQLTKDAFNLYHVSIFVLDEAENVLRLEAGSGEAGERMKQMNKRFKLNSSGVVPQAARERQSVLINDTTTSGEHYKNPLLPDTRSEFALPMLVGETLIGVLDLQSEETNHFTPDDLQVLQTLADRVGVSIRNAQLYADAQAAREQAERSDQVKSMFLASMSHELRTPLNAIINFSQFIAMQMLGPINDRQAETVASVIDSAEHLLSLINDVLDISKIESGSLKLFIEKDIDVRTVAEGVVKTAEVLLADKPVALQTNIAPDLPLIEGDHQRITQILLNIMSNACKFTKEGEIKLDVSQIQ